MDLQLIAEASVAVVTFANLTLLSINHRLHRKLTRKLAAAEAQAETPAALRPYGQQVGTLTQFGETWLDLDTVQFVDFRPADGCGCELKVKGEDTILHVCEEDARCLSAYFGGNPGQVRGPVYGMLLPKLPEPSPAEMDSALHTMNAMLDRWNEEPPLLPAAETRVYIAQ